MCSKYLLSYTMGMIVYIYVLYRDSIAVISIVLRMVAYISGTLTL